MARRVMVLYIFTLFGGVLYSADPKSPIPASPRRLTLVRTIRLDKTEGGVHQVLELADGRFAIRDSTFKPLRAQKLEIYSKTGQRLANIGSYGEKPGSYMALKDVAFDGDRLWVVNMMGRISQFDLQGRFVDSQLLQKPTYHPFSAAVDRQRNRYFITGCLALHIYLDLGCRLVHEYDLSTRRYIRSFLETDPDAVTRKYFGVEDYHIDVDPANGVVYFVDGPIAKLWSIQPSGSVKSTVIESDALGRIPQLDPTKQSDETLKRYYILDRVLVCGNVVLASAAKQGSDKYLLEVFQTGGSQILVDYPAPGRWSGGPQGERCRSPGRRTVAPSCKNGSTKRWVHRR